MDAPTKKGGRREGTGVRRWKRVFLTAGAPKSRAITAANYPAKLGSIQPKKTGGKMLFRTIPGTTGTTFVLRYVVPPAL